MGFDQPIWTSENHQQFLIYLRYDFKTTRVDRKRPDYETNRFIDDVCQTKDDW
jgi:hypothetical protein